MKMIKKALSAVLLGAMLVLMLASCKKEPGIYAWYGGKMKADYILDIKVDGGGGEKTYSVPFEEYRAIFLYLASIAPTYMTDEDGKTIVAIASDDEKTKAIKEVTEETLMDYYSLVALGEKLGITITDEDRAAFEAEREATKENLLATMPQNAEFDGTKEEYAEELYRNSLSLAGGLTPEYYEFTYFRDLLAKRIKMAISVDLGDYLNQSYFRYKQVMILYTKGDSAAEAKAEADIAAVLEGLKNGVSIDDLAALYDNSGYANESYVDSYGNVLGSAAGDTLNEISFTAIKALDFGEVSAVITGDDSDRAAYVAVYQRFEIEEEFACDKGTVSETLFSVPYVGATVNTPYFTRYTLMTESFAQNMACTPVSEKVYDRIAINTLY